MSVRGKPRSWCNCGSVVKDRPCPAELSVEPEVLRSTRTDLERILMDL